MPALLAITANVSSSFSSVYSKEQTATTVNMKHFASCTTEDVPRDQMSNITFLQFHGLAKGCITVVSHESLIAEKHVFRYDFKALPTPCQEPRWGGNAVTVAAPVQTCCFMPTAHQKSSTPLTQQPPQLQQHHPPAPSSLHPSRLGVIHQGWVASISAPPRGQDSL